jgi:hypothetical protein
MYMQAAMISLFVVQQAADGNALWIDRTIRVLSDALIRGVLIAKIRVRFRPTDLAFDDS